MKLADPKKDTIYADLEKFDPQQEPLLREDPSRFVIFPINYQGKTSMSHIVWLIYYDSLYILQTFGGFTRKLSHPSGQPKRSICHVTWTTGRNWRRANNISSNMSLLSSQPRTESLTKTWLTDSCPRSRQLRPEVFMVFKSWWKTFIRKCMQNSSKISSTIPRKNWPFSTLSKPCPLLPKKVKIQSGKNQIFDFCT